MLRGTSIQTCIKEDLLRLRHARMLFGWFFSHFLLDVFEESDLGGSTLIKEHKTRHFLALGAKVIKIDGVLRDQTCSLSSYIH